MTSRRLLLSTVAAGLLLPALPAMADVDEIIVTARKREESILKVPVVVSALDQKQLDQYAVNNLAAISSSIPGLELGQSIGASGFQVSLRGVGASVLNPTIDQSVSLNVDGMQMSQGLAYQVAMFDMAQVQVLKGPQALFYGKASPAGVISVKTADPTDEFDVILRGGYEFEAREKMTEAIVSGPVTDTLKLRLAGKFSDQDGFFKNEAVAAPGSGALNPTHSRIADNQSWMLRGTALWSPTDRFNARLKVNYSKSETTGSGGDGQWGSCPDGTHNQLGLPFDFIAPDNCRIDDVINIVYLDPAAFIGVYNNGVPFDNNEQTFGTLEMNYDLRPDLTLTSVTGLYHLRNSYMINGHETSSGGPFLVVQGGLQRKDFTQELRLTSDFANSPVNFVVGGFYQNGSMDFLVNLPTNQAFTPFIGPVPLAFAYVNHHIELETVSSFGQVLWKIIPDLELGAGVRWTQEHRKHTQLNFDSSLGLPLGVTPLAIPELASSNLSPEVTLTYTPTDQLTLFASYKQAFKSGSFNSAGLFFPGQDASFRDEKVKGAEGGIKSRWLNGDLAINMAGYYYKFKDIQVGANDFDPITHRIVIKTINAASANVYGIDFDMAYTPPIVKGLTLRGAVNWNRARYSEFAAPCWGGQTIAQGCNLPPLNPTPPNAGNFTSQDLKGKTLMRAPEWSATFGLDYEMPVFNDMTLTFGSSTTYTSAYYTNILLRSDMIQDSYIKTNASIALKGSDDGWEVAVIGNNLTNEITTGNCSNGEFQNVQFLPLITGGPVAPFGVEELSCNADIGRTVMLRLTLRPLALMK